jgi:hypothetical protein
MGAHSTAPDRRRFTGGTDAAAAGTQVADGADRPARSSRRTTVATAAVLGALLSVSAVWMNSYAAFSGQTANPGNSWQAGQVSLTDDDGGVTAMFNATNLAPGDTGFRCIRVDYTGSVEAAVKLYATSVVDAGGLGAQLDLVVNEGGGPLNDPGCASFTPGTEIFAGTLAGFGTARTDYATGVAGFTAPAGGGTRTYRITYTLKSTASDAVENATAGLGFTWEAQNT